MAVRQNLIELCKKINDAHYEITPECAEYKALEQWITDEEIEVMLAFDGCMKPNFPGGIAKRAGLSKQKTQEVLDQLTDDGLLIEAVLPVTKGKAYMLPLYTPGIFEFMTLNEKLIKAHPEIAQAFHDHATISQAPHAANTPMGAGVMRVIPVEKAIPAGTKQIKKEQVSYYLKKNAKHITISPCQCRRVRKMMGEGSGDLDEPFCIFLGPIADMFLRQGRGKRISYEEAMQAIERFEKIGCVHQITTLSDGNTAAICNCQPESCLALGMAQYYNAPQMSQSNYVAEIDPEKCVACGECTTTCANNAIQMGQHICSKVKITYPKADLPDDLEWGPERWNPNYRYNRKYVADCGTAPCKTECPAHISVEGYLKLANQGRYMDALELIKRENPFPAVCGRVCNRRCESACTRGDLDSPVAIDDVKRYIADKELKKETRFVPEKLHKYPGKAAIIGAGPAGLSCAYYLAAMGHEVTVFDKHQKPGGMLVYGIPSFRLEKDVVEAEIEVLKELGVAFRMGVDVGKDVTINELRKEGYKGFYIGIGLQNTGKLNIPGEEAEGVHPGMELMNKVTDGEDVNLKGNVVVIGGGNIAADIARTALRCKADHVDLYCLESYDEMPMGEEDRSTCEEEGITIHAGWGPLRVANENGKVTGMDFRKCIKVRNEEGRFDPQFDDNNTEHTECDTVLYCIGQRADLGDLFKGTKVEFNRNGTIKADAFTYQTAEPDIFVGGDIYTGQKFVIDAIAAGKQGAESLHRYVSEGQSLTAGRDHRQFHSIDKTQVDFDKVRQTESYDNSPRQIPGRRKGTLDFKDDRIDLTDDQVRRETSRCLRCGASHVDQNKCLGCGVCTTRCRFDAIHLHKRTYVDSIPYKKRAEELPKYIQQRQVRIELRKQSEAQHQSDK